ncbi:P-loop NTPase fold protein [uncultured Microscilla sp.]|uniref:KAP family P-loop NTPase fold protein n=1 Tax=uncultured Microscilla sp. TaxID=432653 RepID=UPI002629E9F4|nr:P-loop NTPase fold protein [uncultured Microscilla sp.]
MWTDNDTDIDLINYDHLVQSAIDIISNENLLPCTIGIYGEWGSGKSSLMRLIQKELESDEKILVIKFNGWLFEGYEDAKSALMEVILNTLYEKEKNTKKVTKRIGKALRKIQWLKLGKVALKYGLGFAAAGPMGLALLGAKDLQNPNPKSMPTQGQAVGNIGKANLGDFDFLNREQEPVVTIKELHQDFEEILEDTTVEKVVVFIDDLDRCNPDTIIETLEAIKLFLFLKNTSFIISADERIIEQGVKTKFKDVYSEGLGLGKQYLEKLIQFPIHIPRLSNNEMEIYSNLLFTSLYAEPKDFEKIRESVINQKGEQLYSGDITYTFTNASKLFQELGIEFEKGKTDITDALALTSEIIDVLVIQLQGNPRQCKRFLNTLLMRTKMAKTKEITLSQRTLAKIMLLEYFSSKKYLFLADLQASEKGKPQLISVLEKILNKKKQGKQDKGEQKKDKQEDNTKKEIIPQTLIEVLKEWEEDTFIKKLMASEPYLSNVDLRPYFYFSRKSQSSFSIVPLGMSSDAESVFKDISGEKTAKSIMKLAMEKFKNLSEVDVTQIIKAIQEKILRDEKPSSLITNLFKMGEVRKELKSDILDFIENLPTEKVTAKNINQIMDYQKDAPEFKLKVSQILAKWSDHPTRTISTLAKATRKDI